MKRAALLLLVACSDNTVVVTPVIDIPTDDDARPPAFDSLTLSVAHADSLVDISSATFERGETIELPGVPFGDDLVVHMIGREGTTDVAYGRTCQFAVLPDEPVPAPHLFFSKTVKFGQLSTKPVPRLGGAAMTYRDGSGLLVGGSFPDEALQPQALTQIERFDPNTGEYATLHEVARRIDPAVAIVGIGPESRLVIVGGVDPTTNLGAEFAEVIEAERNTDRQYVKFFEPALNRTELTATTLTDGRAVVIGGYELPNPAKGIAGGPSPLVAIISVDTGTTAINPERAQLAHPRYAHSATRLSDEIGAPVLVAGGLNALGKPIKEAELYKPLAEDFSDQFSAQMIVPRWQHQTARLADGSVLFIGGLTVVTNPTTMMDEIVPVKTLELFSPLDGRFVEVGSLRETAGLVGMSATVLPDGRVLIAGGKLSPNDDIAVANAFIASLDPLDGTVRVVGTDSLAVARSGHQATTLCDGTVLVSGGTLNQESYERYNPIASGRR